MLTYNTHTHTHSVMRKEGAHWVSSASSNLLDERGSEA